MAAPVSRGLYCFVLSKNVMTYLSNTVFYVGVFLRGQFPTFFLTCHTFEYLRENISSKSGRRCNLIKNNLQRLNDMDDYLEPLALLSAVFLRLKRNVLLPCFGNTNYKVTFGDFRLQKTYFCLKFPHNSKIKCCFLAYLELNV